MRAGQAIALTVCGTALVIMPQIHSAVLGANQLYAAAIAANRLPPGGADPLPDVSPPSWMALVSTGMGASLMLAAAAGGLAAGREGRRPPGAAA